MLGYFVALNVMFCTPRGRTQPAGLSPPEPVLGLSPDSEPLFAVEYGHGSYSQFVFSSARPPLAGGHLASNDMWLPEPRGNNERGTNKTKECGWRPRPAHPMARSRRSGIEERKGKLAPGGPSPV